ncbi:D-serine ammonia-lyase [Lacticigenium naphthae]|uniref:D-serine ammonia-lyase n=1 Tax=Lacticigenium naphthae TaxID=515351 RepID=UPI0003FDE530|nr:D-serine ammonia-lyase [Lacticigenium naphthae]
MNQHYTNQSQSKWTSRFPELEAIAHSEEMFWRNPSYMPFSEAMDNTHFSFADVEDAEARLQRFASFIQIAFPETEKAKGIIESPITQLKEMKRYIENRYDQPITGDFYLKRDDLLPIAGTIKARGAIYEVLKHAEELALQEGLLQDKEEDYSVFATKAFHHFFSQFNITVGTTGNLGISVGRMGSELGFNVTVHMSAEAKQWKKDFLRSKGVEVIEHQTNFTEAVTKGRAESEQNPKSYFVDDEHSQELFLGYTAGGYRMKAQLAEEGITVDADHPLFVYLPCGIGGSPGGITFGMKQAFGDNVHCFFAEPTEMPSMLVGLLTEEYDNISVNELGLGSLTVADGLAVPRTSGLVAKIMQSFFSGGYTVAESEFKILLKALHDTENIFLEPAALAGVSGPARLLKTKAGRSYLEKQGLTKKLQQATHIAWATGGSMVPKIDQEQFLQESQEEINKEDQKINK